MMSGKKSTKTSVELKQNVSRNPYEIGLVIAALTALIALSYGITSPWSKNHEGYNGAVYSQYAINYIRYGFLATKFGQVGGSLPLKPNEFGYYVDHPPLLPIFVSLFFRIFGEHEWSARLVPVLFSVASVILIYMLGEKLWSKRVGIISAIAFAANPMYLFYGRMVDHEALVTFFALLSVLLYIKWLDGDNRYLWGLCVSIFLGGLTGWPTYYLIPIFGLHYLFFVKKKSPLALMPGFAALIALTLFCLQLKWFGGDSFTVLKRQFLMRSNLDAVHDPSKQIAFNMMLNTLIPQVTYFFTIPLLTAALTGPLASLYNSYKKRDYFSASILIGLFIFALTHVLLFKHGAMCHPYWTYYFLIPLSLSMGVSIDFISSLVSKRIAFVPVLIVFLMMVPLAVSAMKSLYESADPLAIETFGARANVLAVKSSCESDSSSPAYLGQAISKATTPGDTVLTSIPSQELSNWPQVDYYARRNLIGSIDNVESLEKALTKNPDASAMLVLTNNTNPALQQYLLSNYPHTKKPSGNIMFFNLRKPYRLNKTN